MDDLAHELAQSWLNGNLSAVVASIARRPAAEAALLALLVAEVLDADRHRFIAYLRRQITGKDTP